MEQAYRRLIHNLSNHHLVNDVKYDYREIKIEWKSGLSHKLVIPRPESLREKKNPYRSYKYFVDVMPKALWWEEISNDIAINMQYKGVNDIEYDLDEYPNLAYWDHRELRNCKFYDMLILTHTILDFIINNELSEKYPEKMLYDNYNLLLSDDLDKYKMKNLGFYKLARHRERPGELLIKNFMPHVHYGENDPYHLISGNRVDAAKRIYRAIRSLIISNGRAKRPSKKHDISFGSIINKLRFNQKPVKKYLIKQPGIYRKIIRDLELNNKSFYDPDPFMGEKFLAAACEDCEYFYEETCPFDGCFKNLSNFIEYGAEVATRDRYDFSIYDDVKYDPDVYESIFNKMSEKVDIGIIYIKNMWFDEFASKHKPDKYFNMKTSRMFEHCGKWMVYYF